MNIFHSTKRITLFFIFLFFTQTYTQETIIPLTQGGWVGGLSGNVSWDDFNSSATNEEYKYCYNADYLPVVDGFSFSISSRNGRFVFNNLSIGFDLQWSENETTTEIGTGIPNTYYKKRSLDFLGFGLVTISPSLELVGQYLLKHQ